MSGNFFRKLTKRQEIPKTIKEIDKEVIKALGIKKLSVKKARGIEIKEVIECGKEFSEKKSIEMEERGKKGSKPVKF